MAAAEGGRDRAAPADLRSGRRDRVAVLCGTPRLPGDRRELGRPGAHGVRPAGAHRGDRDLVVGCPRFAAESGPMNRHKRRQIMLETVAFAIEGVVLALFLLDADFNMLKVLVVTEYAVAIAV